MISLSTKAGSFVGGEISYEHIGGNKFVLALNVYKTCPNILEPTATISIQSGSCSYLDSVILPLQIASPGGREVTPLCMGLIATTTCHGGCMLGIQLHVYTDTIFLGNNFCSDWVFSFQSCCLDSGFTNLANVGTDAWYVEAKMSNLIVGGDTTWNNSTILASIATPYICVNQPFNYDLSAIEPDGDSLSFRLVQGRSASGVNDTIPYADGYNVNNAIASTPSLSINASTGQMEVTPTSLQQGLISVEIEEWRLVGGSMVQVGLVSRTLMILIWPCSNRQPYISGGGIQDVNGAVYVDSFSLKYTRDSVSFDFLARDFNGDNVWVCFDEDVLNDAKLKNSCFCPINTVSFGWQPGSADTVDYIVSFDVADDGCPLLSPHRYYINFEFEDRTDAGEDIIICRGDGADLMALGGKSWSWSIVPGGDPISVGVNFSCDNCQNVIASPDSTTEYVLTTNIPAPFDKDTVKITVIPSFTTSTTPDTTLCLFAGTQICVFADFTYLDYDYLWSPAPVSCIPYDSCIWIYPAITTTYYVEITGGGGCTKFDSVTVTVDTTSPRPIVLDAIVDSTCSQDSVQLSATLIPGATYDWFPKTSLLPSNTYETIAFPDSTTLYWVTAVDPLSPYCFTSAYLNVIAGPEFQIEILADDTMCSDELMCTIADSTYSTYDFFWLCIPLGWNQAPCISPWVDSTYTYYIRVTAPSGCRKYDTITVNSYQVPFVTYLSERKLCKGDSIQIMPKVGWPPTNPLYLWEPAKGLSNSTILDPIASPDTTTTYKFTVIDSLYPKCPGSRNFTVQVGEQFTPWISEDKAICYGDSVELCAGGDDSSLLYTVTWSPPGSSVSSGSCTMASPPHTVGYGAYIASGGCIKYKHVIVDLYEPKITGGYSSNFCLGDSVQLNSTDLFGYSFQWFGENILNPNERKTMALPSDNSQYIVHATRNMGPHCIAKDTLDIYSKRVRPKISVTAINPTIQPGESTGLVLNIEEALMDTVYSWYPHTGLKDRYSVTPTASPVVTTRYFVTISDNGCTDTSSVLITVEKSTGLGSHQNRTSFSMYPNPTSGMLHLELADTRATQLILVDLLGAELERWEIGPGEQKQELDLSAVRPGVYLLKLTGEGRVYAIGKIIRE